ncbi:hotdog fold thioesterase [Aquibacillus sp. 3ASR75-11]|uniref:Hotdog fold thioesterase n=1 Tax=Terrihalobacillus insolitus TaxID=2950438 RepID=A0A9X3WNA9_9BACI|nr:hotdog fold thioesterase [Terrihalobacillus insolitus]MDC3412395.1 hotdog fold thioesterase [Terrihalobacillus insolitus]MDC3422912.1 hotdog fold thioesterase [Terrihalobacillus insolitus]
MEVNFSNTLMDALDMEIITLKKDLVEIKMPVGQKTHQPMGFLHGGASVALAESAASVGAFLQVDTNSYQVFGIEINANHIKSKRDGWVVGKAIPIHIGKTTMVWEIKIVDEVDQLISISRCTIGIVPLKK